MSKSPGFPQIPCHVFEKVANFGDVGIQDLGNLAKLGISPKQVCTFGDMFGESGETWVPDLGIWRKRGSDLGNSGNRGRSFAHFRNSGEQVGELSREIWGIAQSRALLHFSPPRVGPLEFSLSVTAGRGGQNDIPIRQTIGKVPSPPQTLQ